MAKVRGLLCSRCVSALGLFRDDLALLASATEYVTNTRLHSDSGPLTDQEPLGDAPRAVSAAQAAMQAATDGGVTADE